MISTLPSIPGNFTAGDTIKVRIDNGAFPAPAWRVMFAFAGPDKFSKLATADGAGHLLKLAPGDTQSKRPGVYTWTARAELVADPTEAATIASGSVFITQNAAVGTLSFAENALALIEAHILGRLPSGLSSHSFNGNSLSKIPLTEAEKLRDKYKAEVALLRRSELESQGFDAGAIYPVFFTP